MDKFTPKGSFKYEFNKLQEAMDKLKTDVWNECNKSFITRWVYKLTIGRIKDE